MPRRWIGLMLASGCLVAVLLAGGSAAARADVDCSDFTVQQQAQDFFESHGGPATDAYQLDGDGDGQACELLPCPCSVGGGGGGGSPQPATRDRAKVVDIADGDTIKVRRNGRTRDVRLIGIDTPEVYG